MQRLNLKQIERYHEDGFLVVRNFFTIEECDKLKKILIEEISKGQDILKKTPSETIDKIDANKLADIPRMINKGLLQDIAHRNSKFMSLAKDARLITIMNQLFGEEVKAYRLYRSLSVFKNSKIVQKSELHQDMQYWKGESNKASVWISLNKVTKQNGSLCFLPGSHNKLHEHIKKKREIHNKAFHMEIKNIDQSQKVITEVGIGDIVIFHCCVIHGSEENILGEDRYSLTFTYQPAIDNSHHRDGPAELIEKEKVINY